MKVITVTLNPSLERTLTVHYMAVGYPNHTTQATRLDPAGRGVNISRALHHMEIETAAVILLGTDASGIAYRALIDEEMLPAHIVRVQGQTRSQIVLLDTASKQETIIIEDNEGFSPAEMSRAIDLVHTLIEPGDYVVYAGPLPKGIAASAYIQMIEEAAAVGGNIVLDVPQEALHEAVLARPAMVFMTQNEMEAYFNFPVRTKEAAVYTAHKLQEQGAQNILVLLNQEVGAILATPDETLYIHFPANLKPGTHSGSIASMIAGYLAGQVQNQAIDQSLRLGMAASLFTVQQVGAQFPRPADLIDFIRQVEITPLGPIEMQGAPQPPETA